MYENINFGESYWTNILYRKLTSGDITIDGECFNILPKSKTFNFKNTFELNGGSLIRLTKDGVPQYSATLPEQCIDIGLGDSGCAYIPRTRVFNGGIDLTDGVTNKQSTVMIAPINYLQGRGVGTTIARDHLEKEGAVLVILEQMQPKKEYHGNAIILKSNGPVNVEEENWHPEYILDAAHDSMVLRPII
ncbi:MAG: hypothetical protein KAS12_00905 [Candidatus Aenigmarchaeota archaeon]|nr:hypothetical protein [Candidatus Aenigmarchaeota archaeon]